MLRKRRLYDIYHRQVWFLFCQKGEVEVALNDKSYLISKGSVCIYMTGSLLRIQRISKDIKGIMLEVDLNYIIPIVNKIVNSENLLYLREIPVSQLQNINTTIWNN